MATSADIEDLLVLARRGRLSEPEQRRLEMLLKTSDTARALHETGLAFDRMDCELPGDAALLDRVNYGRCSLNTTAKRGRRRWLAWLAMGALLSGAAAASWWQGAASGSDRFVHLPSPTAKRASGTPRGSAPLSSAPAPAERSSAPSNPAGLSAAAPSPRARPQNPGAGRQRALPGENSLPSASEPSASEAQASAQTSNARALFTEANRARKGGQPAQALELYRQLQQRYPASPEAQLSLVVSGRMLLNSGAAERALDKFNRYLQSGARGGLAEEALSGKARALGQLGRPSSEQRAWQELLERFPESVHAATARQRLGL